MSLTKLADHNTMIFSLGALNDLHTNKKVSHLAAFVRIVQDITKSYCASPLHGVSIQQFMSMEEMPVSTASALSFEK